MASGERYTTSCKGTTMSPNVKTFCIIISYLNGPNNSGQRRIQQLILKVSQRWCHNKVIISALLKLRWVFLVGRAHA